MSGRYVLPVTIDHTLYAADVTGPVIRLILTLDDLKSVANGGKVAESHGYDLVPCANSDGSGAFPYYLNFWDASTGQIALLFLDSSLSSSVAPLIYLRFGDASATNGSSPADVFDDGTYGAWDWGDGVTAVTTDLTGNGNDGTFVNLSGSDAIVTPIGGGIDLGENTSTNSKITVAITGSSAIQFGEISGSLLWQTKGGIGTATSGRVLMELADQFSKNGFYGGEVKTHTGGGPSTEFLTAIEIASGPIKAITADPCPYPIPAGTWIHMAGRYDAAALTISNFVTFIDGDGIYRRMVIVVSTGALRGTSPLTTSLTFGASVGGFAYVDGVLAHYRMHTVPRTDAWFEAEANNLIRPGAFFTPGSTVDLLAGVGPDNTASLLLLLQ